MAEKERWLSIGQRAIAIVGLLFGSVIFAKMQTASTA